MRNWVSLALLSLLLLAGCAPQTQMVGGETGRAPFTKGVSLSPSTTELVLTTAQQPGSLVGRTAACDFPDMIVQRIPVVMAGVKPDYEAITKAAPQVIFYDKALISEADVQPLQNSGVKLLPLDSTTLEGYKSYIRLMATTIGSEQPLSEYLDKVNGVLSKNRGAIGENNITVLFIMDPTKAPMAAGTDGFLADIAKSLGVTPVGPTGNKWAAINPEEIIRLNPRVIFTTAGNAEPLKKDPRFASLQAVQKDAVYGINPDVLLRAGSRVDALIDAMGAQLARNKN